MEFCELRLYGGLGSSSSVGMFGSLKYHRYWYNEESGEVFCLAEAPNKEAAEVVHREAHGLVADEITEVEEGS